MPNDYSDKESPEDALEDALMDEVIRAARKDPEEGFVRPDAETIAAYVLGTATQQQKEQVTAALIRSADFRREILHMAQDIEALALEDPLADKKKAMRVVAPDRREFLKGFGERVTSPATRETLWARLWRWRVPQFAVPAAVVAGVILSIVVRTTSFVQADFQYVDKLAPRDLVTLTTRGAVEPGLKSLAGTPVAAAMVEFKSLVESEAAADSVLFRLKAAEDHKQIPSAARVVTVRLVPEAGGKTREFRIQLPQEVESAAGPTTLWVLTVPSGTLYRADVVSDRIQFPWKDDMEREGCLTITYPVDYKYRASDGFGFRLE